MCVKYRCFFIHLGVATQYHPFALQTYFRHTAAADCAEEGNTIKPNI